MSWLFGCVCMLILGICTGAAQAATAELSVEIETETALELNQTNVQKAEVIVKPEISGDLSPSVAYTVIPKLSLDAVHELSGDQTRDDNYSRLNGPVMDNRHSSAELSEAYIDFAAAGAYWRLGKQQVVWGQADGLKVLDVVNPQDYREFNLDEFEDSRIPTWMLNTEFDVGDASSVQLLVIPDTTYSKLADAGSAYEITSPKDVPNPEQSPLPVSIRKPERPAGMIETGLRYRSFFDGWDLTFNYLYHMQDIPVLYRRISAGELLVEPVYEQNHVIGTTASNAFGDLVVRLEAGFNTHTFHLREDLENLGIAEAPEIGSVLGLDYQGISDWLFSYQWFQSTLTQYDDAIIRNRTRMRHTFLLRRNLWNDTLALELFVLLSDEDQDGQVRTEARYQLTDEVQVWIGADVFYGPAEGQFGQFDDTDRVVMGFEFGI